MRLIEVEKLIDTLYNNLYDEEFENENYSSENEDDFIHLRHEDDEMEGSNVPRLDSIKSR